MHVFQFEIKDAFIALWCLFALSSQFTLSFKRVNIWNTNSALKAHPNSLTFDFCKLQSVHYELVPGRKTLKKGEMKTSEGERRFIIFFLESSQGFVAHSQLLFEFPHQWCFKGWADDRMSVKSRSLEDREGRGMTWNLKNGRQPGSVRLTELKVAVCLLVLAAPSVNQIISRGEVEGDQQKRVSTAGTRAGSWWVTVA